MATISKATVVKINNYGDDVREYIFKLDKYHFFDPGTFVQLALDEPKNNRWPESRNFSVASYLNDEQTIRLVIRRIGAFTNRIFSELNVGVACYMKYSFGDFLLPFFDNQCPIICIAGGTGIAPFISFVEYLTKEGDISRLHLYYSAKNRKELICLDELKRLVPSQNLHIHLTREEIAEHAHGRLTAKQLLSQFGGDSTANYYICGGEEFTQQFKSVLAQNGAINIHTDEW
ncbi:ferredoxin-NADP reductase [Breznakibacter xylanolyticus]|uniref:Ferredoxin-NADP reductase n=1 Tax=Breznakibacter xylanolyticus TaxID=990 RepID=A0A2W7P705_9BACT|nr:FAD-dependent oxidoreductase [Breznakibacter xylanolyticus]PZX19172.1 ferredoxin-NADP reductase [Breznakibacter xylanolyticus]